MKWPWSNKEEDQRHQQTLEVLDQALSDLRQEIAVARRLMEKK